MPTKPLEYPPVPPATDKDNPTSPEDCLDFPNVQIYTEKLIKQSQKKPF